MNNKEEEEAEEFYSFFVNGLTCRNIDKIPSWVEKKFFAAACLTFGLLIIIKS